MSQEIKLFDGVLFSIDLTSCKCYRCTTTSDTAYEG